MLAFPGDETRINSLKKKAFTSSVWRKKLLLTSGFEMSWKKGYTLKHCLHNNNIINFIVSVRY